MNIYIFSINFKEGEVNFYYKYFQDKVFCCLVLRGASSFISLLCHVNVWKTQLSLTYYKIHVFPIKPHQNCCVRSHRTKSVPNIRYQSALSSQICRVKTTALLQLAVYLQLFRKFCKAEQIIFTELFTFAYFCKFSTSLMNSILQKSLPYFLDRTGAWHTTMIDTIRKSYKAICIFVEYLPLS